MVPLVPVRVFAVLLAACAPVVASAASGAHAGPPLGELLPLWSVAPFAAMLVAIAVMPLVAEHFWEHNRNKAILSVVLGVPVAAWIATHDVGVVGHTLLEYGEFILLLGALFVIAGGVVVRGTLAGTPGLNAGLLAIGAVVASFVGTTGASMLLIRPILRANSVRKNVVHVVVFFIFIVSNAGGLLTPLGDPPLFLGFLRGVPFLWTLQLWPEWLLVNGALIAIFYVVDSTLFRKEDLATPGDLDEVAVAHKVPISIAGKRNFLYLAGVVAVLLASGTLGLPFGVQEGGMLLMVGLSWFTTRRELRRENRFIWGPIVEVAVVFFGIFCTMIPALAILNAKGSALGITTPWQFFWATGLLSSFLDNAPTYLTFAAAASAIQGTDAADLSTLISTEVGARYLVAISLGAVFMGANTYIGNGPNFMVKAIAEQSGVRMPGFFGYMAWSCAILLPLFGLVTWLFLV
jgi:Na+/H+ antiporter NhaD/arsenite permease-like protein